MQVCETGLNILSLITFIACIMTSNNTQFDGLTPLGSYLQTRMLARTELINPREKNQGDTEG